jgi:hypothetical protein
VLAPLFGDTYHRYKAADSKEEFVKSRETATAAASWGSSIVGSAVQTYGVAALINATGTLTYKGAAYLGSLIFFASTAPSVSSIEPRIVSEVNSHILGHLTNHHREASCRPGCCRCRCAPVRDSWPQRVPHLLGHQIQPIRLDHRISWSYGESTRAAGQVARWPGWVIAANSY